jgi:hypothetical protein
VVAVAGSRRLPPAGQLLINQVCFALAGAGAVVSVGCCVGADECVLNSYPVGALRVFAAFGPVSPPWPAPQGRYWAHGSSRPVSAVPAVAKALFAGAQVSWWAGGGPSLTLPARLVARTVAVVSAASAGVVVFFASPRSRGSALVVRLAVARGVPVVAFALGVAPMRLPVVGAGCWVACSSAGVWAGAQRWQPAQGAL